MNYSNPLVYAAPFFIAFIIWEIWADGRGGRKREYNFRDFKASLFIGVGTLVFVSLLKLTLVGAMFVFVYELFNPIVDGVRMNYFGYESFGYEWYFFVVCQLGDDFSFYWYHRLSHTVRLFWAAHLPHHSSNHYNFGTGVRIGWFVILLKPFFYFWLLAIGFHYEMLVICMGIETIYQFQLHTSYIPKLGILEKFLVTHKQHQIHHSKFVEHLDMNHGGILCIWDRMFGTYYDFAPKSQSDLEYGVLHPPGSYNPFVILTHEFKDIWTDVKGAKSFRDKFMFVFGPPGWSRDGSRQTSKQLQNQHKTQQSL